MNDPGVLLDAGPLVALLSKNDARHQDAVRLFGACAPPLRTCEAVVAEACFLIRKVHPAGPSEVAALAARGVFSIGLSATDHWNEIRALLTKYADRPASFADACLIRCAETHREPRILTFDDDFTIYRWGRRNVFEVLAV